MKQLGNILAVCEIPFEVPWLLALGENRGYGGHNSFPIHLFQNSDFERCWVLYDHTLRQSHSHPYRCRALFRFPYALKLLVVWSQSAVPK